MRLIYIVALVVFVHSVYGQGKKLSYRQHEVGFLLGGSYYIGDLNPRNHFFLAQPGGGVLYRFAPNYRYAFRGQLSLGNIKGDDSQSELADQLQRNLNFKSYIMEAAALAEFNFVEYRIGNDKHKFSPFIFAGISVFGFNPQGNIKNQWVALQNLKTEGQSKKYKLTQLSIPFGVGFKLNVAKQVGIGMEWGPRKTFTDYLDDVSGTYLDPAITPPESVFTSIFSDRSKAAGNNIGKQRGNPRTRDWYFFFGLTLNIKLNTVRKTCHAYG